MGWTSSGFDVTACIGGALSLNRKDTMGELSFKNNNWGVPHPSMRNWSHEGFATNCACEGCSFYVIQVPITSLVSGTIDTLLKLYRFFAFSKTSFIFLQYLTGDLLHLMCVQRITSFLILHGVLCCS